MKNKIALFIILLCSTTIKIFSQINPVESPYYDWGPYSVLTEEIVVDGLAPELRIHRPENTDEKLPLLLFQQGANTPGVFNIVPESYDLYTQHLASYGYIVVVMSINVLNPTLFTDVETTYDWIKTQTEDPTTWWSKNTDISKTIVGGHSFGGVTTSELLARGTEKAQGIVYLASFPAATQASTTYEGKVLSIAGSEDTSSTPEETKEGYESFEASSCKNYVLVEGLNHGGFGDYSFEEQPIGSIGRDNATATIRHYLVSFMESNFKDNVNATEAFYTEANRPNTTSEFLNEGCENNTLSNSNYILLKNFNAYHNTVENILKIELNEILKTAEIYSVFGSNVLISNSKEINVKDLGTGMYVLKITTADNKTGVKKIIIR